MNRNFLQLGQSGWWVVVIILVALAFSYFLYAKKKVPWNGTQNKILATLRFLAVFMILLLLLEPSVKRVINTTEKPVIGLAIDNSQSGVASITDSISLKASIEKLTQGLEELDLDVDLHMLDRSDSLQFNQKTTNLSSLFKNVNLGLAGKNFAATILVSDGIFNRGSSPAYRSYIAPIFTVGLGDTIPPRDIKIARVLYNRVTFKGNETPIEVEVHQKGYLDRTVKVTLSEEGKVISEKNLKFTKDVEEVTFLLKNEEEDLRHLRVSVSLFEDEAIRENNSTDLFMEVIDGREKVLIVASAPHPDIKAIRSTLEGTDNYETDLYIPDINDQKPNEIFDVVIFHGAFTSGINFQPKESPGIWYILNNESSLTSVNRNLPYLNIKRNGSQPDKVTGSFNQNFSKFKIEGVSAFEEFPPLEVPFGDYTTSGPVEVLMYQKLGSITTKKPLMAFYDDGTKKSAVLMGQNIWRWKLQESAINDNAAQFQNFITKTVQFLSVKNDKKRFQFRPRNTSFLNSQSIIFDAEVYNDIYERVYGNSIKLTINSESGETRQFDFEDSEFNSSFNVPPLESGVYSYVSSTNLGGKTYTDRGDFIVENVNPEYVNLTADHNLLKVVSIKSGGEYTHFSNMDEVVKKIEARNFKSVIRSEENVSPMHRSLLWFIVIFLLFSAEWLLRKYWGGY